MTAITAANEILQEDLGPDGIANAAYTKNPGFGLTKKHKFTGSHYRFPVQYGYASNRSRTASTALNKSNTTQFWDFQVPTVADYDAKDISKKMLAEAENPNVFVQLLRNVTESVIHALSNNAGSDFFGNRGASIGRVGSGNTGATITLKDTSDITKFYPGQVLGASSADGLSGSLRAQGTYCKVDSIDRAAGTITTTGNWNDGTTGISGLLTDDYLFPLGDFGIGRAGLSDWCPDSASGLGTAFYNVTRSVDATRGAGTRLSVTGLPISQAIRQVGAIHGREEGEADVCFMSFVTYNDLCTERDLKVLEKVRGAARPGSGEETTVGFDGIKIAGASGTVDIYPDRSCNDSHFYLAKESEMMCIHSQANPVVIEDEDGQILARNPTDFTFDIRGQAFLNFVFSDPKNLAVGVF